MKTRLVALRWGLQGDDSPVPVSPALAFSSCRPIGQYEHIRLKYLSEDTRNVRLLWLFSRDPDFPLATHPRLPRCRSGCAFGSDPMLRLRSSELNPDSTHWRSREYVSQALTRRIRAGSETLHTHSHSARSSIDNATLTGRVIGLSRRDRLYGNGKLQRHQQRFGPEHSSATPTSHRCGNP
jgi:hypothetical protein